MRHKIKEHFHPNLIGSAYTSEIEEEIEGSYLVSQGKGVRAIVMSEGEYSIVYHYSKMTTNAVRNLINTTSNPLVNEEIDLENLFKKLNIKSAHLNVTEKGLAEIELEDFSFFRKRVNPDSRNSIMRWEVSRFPSQESWDAFLVEKNITQDEFYTWLYHLGEIIDRLTGIGFYYSEDKGLYLPELLEA